MSDMQPITLSLEGNAYSIRPATSADVPFLAHMQHEASLPPANFSFWDIALMGMDIDTLRFIETVMRLNAGAWGSVDQFLIMEQAGRPIAAAAGIEPDDAFARGPVRIADIDRIGVALGWSPEATEAYRERYEEQWPDPEGEFPAAATSIMDHRECGSSSRDAWPRLDQSADAGAAR